jgi:hypothetical protein
MGIATMTTETSIFDRPVPVPDGWLELARKRGWPEDFVQRALNLRVPRFDIEYWLTHDRVQLERITAFLDTRERIMFGTMRVREATWSDDDALADLYANAPEDIGEWEVTVERSPYPFAQFRLQEHPNIQVVEDRGVVLAAAAHSGRNTIIGGVQVSAHIASAWRVRRECRGQGISNMLRMFGGPGCAWYGAVNYWYIRDGNQGALGWITALRDDLREQAAGGELPGRALTVQHFPARPFDGDAAGIRSATPDDAASCIALINRTHGGQDFFRPYSEEFLRSHLDDPFWGPKPFFWQQVYTWDNFFVVEEDGCIVACAGLWDRGKNVRERWRHKTSGDERVVDSAALMDFGYAEGREDAMARLAGYLIGRTHELSRSDLMVPLEQLPALAARLAPYEPAPEVRRFCVDQPFEDEGFTLKVNVTRPYTDLAYW